MNIAIIGGSGKMGKWFARFLIKEGYDVIITGRDKIRLDSAGKELGVSTASNIQGIKGSDIILLSVSIDSFEEVVREISPHISFGQIVIDITSIKEQPVNIMHRYLKGIDILGTHPVFGPGARDLNSQNFVLTPTNDSEMRLAQKVKSYLETRGSRISIMSPADHDQMMAVVLGLAHFISIVTADTLVTLDRLPQLKAVGGSTYRVLTTLVESVVSEDPELYATLQMHLPHLEEIENLFQMNTSKWANLVKNKDKTGFKESMTTLKNKFSENNTDFGQAYENMYKIMEWL
jgi:prephenate dehydrogenase